MCEQRLGIKENARLIVWESKGLFQRRKARVRERSFSRKSALSVDLVRVLLVLPRPFLVPLCETWNSQDLFDLKMKEDGTEWGCGPGHELDEVFGSYVEELIS